jgi:glycosyltransferase involved in cell wall biosynthesis
MRILVLNFEFPPLGGGAAPVSYELSRRYVERGHSVDLVTMGYDSLPLEEVVEGIRVIRVPCLRSRKEICGAHELLTFVISATIHLVRRLRHEHYDVCHTHFLIPTGLVALVLKRLFGVPFIVSVHGSDVPGYNPDRFSRLHRFTRPLLRLVASEASKVIILSDYLGDLVRVNVPGFPLAKLAKIPNGIDSKSYQPTVKEKVILSTGRLLPRKGFQYLLEAVADHDIGYEVHICGDGPMRPQLESIAARSRTKVVLHGWVDNQSDTYRNLLNTAAIYVLASSRENASISLLEGMCAGCAVVTTSVSGCPETVGDAGLLVAPEDTSDLKAQLDLLMSDEDYRRRLQTKARQRVLEIYDWARITNEYEQTLIQAVNEVQQVDLSSRLDSAA